MKKVNVVFKQDPERNDIGVLFTASEMDEEVVSLMERVSDPLSHTITVYDSNNRPYSLKEDRIIRFSSDGKSVKVTSDEGEYVLKASMRDIEHAIHPLFFMRTSRYDIINLQKVEHFDFSVSGSLCIRMKGGLEIWASRRYISDIRRKLMERKDLL